MHLADSCVIEPPAVNRPLGVEFCITNRCNLKCLHCCADSGPHGGELPLKQVKEVIDALATESIFAISLIGGEPFLRKDLFDVLEYLRKKDLYLMRIASNGTLIEDAVAKRIRRIGVGHVQVSLDGHDARTHERVRGVEGSFSRAVNGIRSLVRNRVPVHVRTMLTRDLDLRSLLDLVTTLGVTELAFNSLELIGRAPMSKSCFLSYEEHRRLVPVLSELARRYSDRVRVDPGITERLSFSRCKSDIWPYILHDGGIYPCSSLVLPEFCGGNILSNSPDEIWRSTALKEGRRKCREGGISWLDGIHETNALRPCQTCQAANTQNDPDSHRQSSR